MLLKTNVQLNYITMRKLFTLLTTLALLCAVGCEEQGDDNVNPNDKPNTEQPEEKPEEKPEDGSGDTEKPEDQTPDDNPSISDTPLADIPCAANEILYTTKYDLPIELGNTQGFGGNLVYNTYENGVGRLTFGNDVTAIPASGFKNCNSIENIKLPDGLTSVGYHAFYGCASLKELFIPDSVNSIGTQALAYCTGLQKIYMSSNITSWGWSIFEGCTQDLYYAGYMPNFQHSESGLFYGSKFESVEFASDIVYIGKYAFYGCSNLKYIVIPDSLTSVEPHAFDGCTSLAKFMGKNTSEDGRCIVINGELDAFAPAELTEYTIPDGVTSVGDYAFYNCSNITKITIPEGVAAIGDNAFDGCSCLVEVYCNAVYPPEIGSEVFKYTPNNRIINVPRNSLDDYNAVPNWRRYLVQVNTDKLHVGDLVDFGGARGVVYYVSKSSVEAVSIIGGGFLNYDEAVTWCSNYGKGWHLPTRQEAYRIITKSTTISTTLSSNGYTPLGNKFYWTSSKDLAGSRIIMPLTREVYDSGAHICGTRAVYSLK